MGCIFSKEESNRIRYNENEQKEYSWDKRDRFDPKRYMIENLKDEVVIKLPGTVNGEQFQIQNCQNSCIYILDHINTISIDECVNCRIILGPIKGSAFLRDCTSCNCIMGSGQFRARDCKKLNIFLCCPTQPIIESCVLMFFGCYQLYYPEIEDHFHKSELSFFNNCWNNIHDYTPWDSEKNAHLLPRTTVNLREYFNYETFENKFTINAELSVVPYTHGVENMISTSPNDTCMVAFFSDGQHVDRARAFIRNIVQENADCILITCKEIKLKPEKAETIFRTTAYHSILQRGKVIGLYYNGTDCIKSCQKVAMDIATSTGSTGLVYVSSNPKTTMLQINLFFSYINDFN